MKYYRLSLFLVCVSCHLMSLGANARTAAEELELELTSTLYKHLSSVRTSHMDKPYSALFWHLLESSNASKHYPTLPEIQTVLQNKLIVHSSAHTECTTFVDSDADTYTDTDNIQAFHYLSLISTFLGDSFPPRLVLEFNCDQDLSSVVGMWGGLIAWKSSELFFTAAESVSLLPIVLCANTFQPSGVVTSPQDSLKRQFAFGHHLRKRHLSSGVIPFSHTPPLTTSTWLSQFHWLVDVIHLNAHSCESLLECGTLVHSSWALLRPGGVMMAQQRLTQVAEADTTVNEA